MGKTSSNNIKKEFENLRNNLLDLTLRNQLLNFKPRAKTIEVINQSPLSVYQTLILQKKKMQFVPNKKDRRSNKDNDGEKNRKKSRFSALWEHPPIDLSIFSEGDKSLKADLTPNELQKRLFYINQQASTMFQEQGYNILYLAIGFLEWRDNFKPKEVHLAPLILIPVVIERKKVGKSFSIYWNEEDLQTNISLQAKLAEEGIELPEFKITSYIEGVEHYLSDVKNAIRKKSDWKVTKHISLGFFSFTKFVMYNDLNPESWEENVDLTKQELIQAIFDPKKNIHEESFNENDVDKELLYKDMYQVLDADSSQIAVIEDVKAGRNLVVEGPPGTGKSQTIVNIIAELLASGKSVLFVSEKMAALEVVKSRLDKIGLGKFVLELHSHKTKRKKLLKEIQKSTNVRAMDNVDINQTLRKLETLRHQLDVYANIIHQPLFDVKMSPFDLYGLKESAEDYFSNKYKEDILPLVRYKSPENYTLKDLDDMIIDLENLAELHATITKNNPWSKCDPKSLLPSDLREIEILINDTLEALNIFNLESERLHENFGIKSPKTLRDYEKSLESLELLDDKNFQLIDSSILTNKVWLDNPKEANKIIQKLENYQMTEKIMKKFNSHILNENIDTLIDEMEKEKNKRFKIFGTKNFKEELEYLYKINIPNDKQALSDLKLAKKHIKYKKELNDIDNKGSAFFGELWHLDASIVDLKEASIWIKKFNHYFTEGLYNQDTINLLSNTLFDIDSKNEIKNYLKSAEKFITKLTKLETKLNPRTKLIFKKETKDVSFKRWEKQLNSWKGQISSLHLWSQYLNKKNICLNSSAKLFIDTIEKRNIEKNDVKPLVLGNFADSLLNIIFAENESLSGFIGELHQNKISEFQELDSKIIELNRRRIFQKLNKKTPKVFGAGENPEAKVLAGEFTRKRGHLPVRTLLEKSGGIIKQIKPCFMMSPLSIAQYLDPTNPKLQFDVVIFDEASQVKPEDALGAFMRAKTAVVMGDTQQLPPTSFFDQMTDMVGVDEVATALDMESILHLCKLSFPVKMLKWHYRSRHESLISVSNREFYDDELLVYPSPSHNTEELGLKFKYNPDTVYERGKSSANPLEARAVVKEIFKHFNKFGDKKSIGVGTFSVSQMNAVLEELEIERKMHPELEPLFSDKMNERFFVKNLETIQGDERDVILISVGYGFDQNRKMSLNFGPLNQDGGERRLNVLITRAREKCVVFSNFKSHNMHLTANPPSGAKALKEFLEYAENVSQGNIINKVETEEPFEDAVYKFLIENDYEVDKQVGCAGFRVDLAIIDKNNPGKYFLGIQCDGKNYSSSKVARDRDRLRQQVLNGLGWNLYHLWSTDWYRNRDITREKLLSAIEDIKNKTFIQELKEMKIVKIPSDDDIKITNPIEEDEEFLNEENINYDISDDDFNEISNITENSNELSLENNHFEDIIFHKSNVQNDNTTIIDNVKDSKKNDNNFNKTNIDYDINDDNFPNDLNSANLKTSVNSINNNSNYDNIEPIDNTIAKKSNYDNSESIDNTIAKKFDKDFNYNTEILDSNSYNEPNLNENINLEKKTFQENNNNFNNNIYNNKNQNNINKNDESHEDLDNDNKYNDFSSSTINKINKFIKKPKIKFLSHLNDDLLDSNEDNGKDILKNNEKDLLKDNDNSNKIDDSYDKFDDIDLENEIKKALESIDENYSFENEHINNDYHNMEENNHINQFTDLNIVNSDNDIINHNTIENNGIDYEDINNNAIESSVIDDNINDNSSINNNNNNNNNILKNSNEFYKEPNNNNINDFENNANSIVNESSTTPNNDKENNNNNNGLDINKDDLTENTSEYHDVNFDNEEDVKSFDEFDRTTEFDGAFDLNNPLRRNSINNLINDNSDYKSQDIRKRVKSVSQSINEIKNEVMYINKSLNEIENPTIPKNFVVIDRTNDSFLKNSNGNINENSNKYIDKYIGDITFQDNNLENIVENINSEYIEIEKERKKDANKFKEVDNTKTLNKKLNIEDMIIPYKITDNIHLNNVDEFYQLNDNELIELINKIVITEGPIHINELIVRIKKNCHLKRIGSKFKERIFKGISLGENNGLIISIDNFLSSSEIIDIQIRKRKSPNIDYISNEEIEENIKLILKFITPIETKEIIKKVARNFGFKATSKKTSTRINSILDYMLANEIIKNTNGKIEFVIID